MRPQIEVRLNQRPATYLRTGDQPILRVMGTAAAPILMSAADCNGYRQDGGRPAMTPGRGAFFCHGLASL